MRLQLDVLEEKTFRQLNIVPTQHASTVFNFFLDNGKYREKLKTMHVGVTTNLENMSRKTHARDEA